jgi:hypothetical protein
VRRSHTPECAAIWRRFFVIRFRHWNRLGSMAVGSGSPIRGAVKAAFDALLLSGVAVPVPISASSKGLRRLDFEH